MSSRILWALALLVIIGTAQAATVADARAHFKAIAKGDVAMIMNQYSDNAVLQWVGGPLDGAYGGPAAIRGVWDKFTKANTPARLEVRWLHSSANPKGATVTANVEFRHGKTALKVRYVLTYRGDKLVNEVWQVAPHLRM